MTPSLMQELGALLVRPDAIPVVLMLGCLVVFSVQSLKPRRD